MPTITVENIPEELYKRLKRSASIHQRSLNDEVLACIQSVLGVHKIDVEDTIARARELREKMPGIWLTDDEINKAKRAGRP